MAAAYASWVCSIITECKIMRATEIITESFLGKNSRRIYDILLSATGAGPMDGGCVVMAQALQIKYGGQIKVLVGYPQKNSNNEVALHAVVETKSMLVDALGADSIDNVIRRFEQNELAFAGGAVTGIRAIQPDDLPDASRDNNAAIQISKLLR